MIFPVPARRVLVSCLSLLSLLLQGCQTGRPDRGRYSEVPPVAVVGKFSEVRALLHLSKDRVLTMKVANQSDKWLVCDNLIDVDNEGLFNAERIVIRSGNY